MLHNVFQLTVGVILVLLVSAQTSDLGSVTNVLLLYETLCPGCRMAISNDVPKIIEKFGGDIFFSLVPYGLADVKIGPAGDLKFYCHHGPEECKGNAWHACSHLYMRPKERLEYAICTMSGDRKQLLKALRKCTDSAMAAKLKECAEGPQGTAIVKLMADITQTAGAAVSPKDNLIPWTPYAFIDGSPEAEYGENQTLIQLICKKAKNRPRQCKH